MPPNDPQGTLPPTTIRSWRQEVIAVDPDYQIESTRPIVYEFSNGRKFRQKPDPYSTP